MHVVMPKYSFLKTPEGEKGLGYLCEGYKYLFKKIDPYMKKMAKLIREGKPAYLIKDEFST